MTARSVPESGPLFVYGSLSFDDVLRAVLGRVPATARASVTGWRTVALRERVFPGLVRAADGRVDGLVVTDLGADEWALLDSYEAPFYDLALVDLDDGGRAWTYVCNADAPVLEAGWDRDGFAARHLAAYLERCTTWRRSLDA